jgi:hypothetical protein
LGEESDGGHPKKAAVPALNRPLFSPGHPPSQMYLIPTASEKANRFDIGWMDGLTSCVAAEEP